MMYECIITASGECDMHIDGLVRDCGISSALALEIPQSSTKPSIDCSANQTLVHALSDVLINGYI